MLCKAPYVKGYQAYGCGQCLPCRLNRRRLWTHRILLESKKHAENSFLTLTYDNENLPENGTLLKKDAQDWLKRFRHAISPLSVRYFLVGEYGDESQRPHYHACLFGVGPSFADVVQTTWKKGHIMLGTLTHDSAQYVAGYVTKKMTSKADPRLNGREPEFARMSLKPGIGATAMEDLADVLTTKHGCELITNIGDVPMSLQHGNKSLPLGRYLRRKLRETLDFETTGGQETLIRKQTAEMRDMLKDALPTPFFRAQALIAKNKQKVRSIETKAKIYSKKGSI